MKKLCKVGAVLLLMLPTLAAVPFEVFADDLQAGSPTEEVEEKGTMTSNINTQETTASESESSMQSTGDSTSSSSSSSSSSNTTTTEESTASSSSESTSQSTSSSESHTEPSSSAKPAESTTPSKESTTTTAPKQSAPSKTTQSSSVQDETTQAIDSVQEERSIHFEKDESVESFIRKISESAQKIGKEKDLYASVMIAQAILESASGQSQLAQAPYYNLFGIKGAYQGASVSMATMEDDGTGTLYDTQANFRVYKNYEESFNDYGLLIREGLSGDENFYAGVWKSNAATYQEATQFLTGRYATDTTYNEKLDRLIETYDLTQYDKEIQPETISTEGYIVPVVHYTISSAFGERDGGFHRGLDFAASQGEPIHASKAGTVITADYHSSWGNYVVIQHEDGMTTLYAHQQEYIVKVGDKVDQGQTIGYVGSTGNSTGPHLHLEICLDSQLSQSRLIDPATVLKLD